MNEESQRITKRRNLPQLSILKKKKKEINAMGKPTDLFKEIGDTKGKCHANRGTI